MPEGYDLKKILTRTIRRAGVRVSNRVMATRLLTARPDGQRRIAGVHRPQRARRQHRGDPRRRRDPVLRRLGPLGLPASGYLYGTYENPANAGDGYSLAYHAGRRADRHRVLPDQPTHQGLQRPRLRLCHRSARRPHRERARPPLHRERLLERPDDARVLPRAALRERAGLPEARSPGARDPDRDRAGPAPHRAPQPRALPRRARPQLRRTTWSRCTSRRSACAAGTADRACG